MVPSSESPASRFSYPVFLDLHEIPVLVVGGGRIGWRKAVGLLASGAAVRLVAEEVSEHVDRVLIERCGGEVRGHRGATAWSWGEAIGVFIDPADEDARNFTVTAVSEHIAQGQITGQDFTYSMIATLKAHLDM